MNTKSLHTLEYDKIISLLEGYAATVAGKSLCKNLLPMNDVEEIRTAQLQTTAARLRITRQGGVSFGGVRDYTASLLRLEVGSTLSAPELLAVSSSLDVAAKVKNYGRKSEPEDGDELTIFFDSIEPLTPLAAEIKRCIISEEEISDDASPGLRAVRRQMHQIDDKVHAVLNSMLASAKDYLQDAVLVMRDGRYCLPVRAEYKSQVQGLVHDQSGSGGTYFIEPMAVVNLGNELKELEIKEKKEIEIILADLSAKVAEETEQLRTNYKSLIELDFIFAKGSFSASYKGSEPTFNTERKINIIEGRHPLLDPKKVVPITVNLGDAFDLLVITGPNTGGKTVTLKTIGLLTLMGEAGLHIPARHDSELAVFDDVFADIGDEQSIEQSLSTFSAHMTNIVDIMRDAGESSLVLFDELGAGTDPTEGAALAISILSSLHNRGIRTVATTHYSELKLFALETSGVENASCEFDVASLRPTYRLLIGIPGKSNAFAISKKLGLSDKIIEGAKLTIGEEDEAFEDLISDLEDKRRGIELQEAEAKRLKDEIETLRAELGSKKERLDEQRENILREAREEAKGIVQEAKAFADKSIRDMHKAGMKVSKEVEQGRSSLREKADSYNKDLAIKPKKSGELKASDLHIGDDIRVISLGINGTVSSLPDAKGNLFVQMGIMRSQVKLTDIELIETQEEDATSKKSSGFANNTKAFSVSTELNLVGMYVDDAMPALEKYLDDAFLAHLGKVRIIHGRGTGKLKAAVQTMLRKDKRVEKYYTAEYNEGGYGATIVEFK